MVLLKVPDISVADDPLIIDSPSPSMIIFFLMSDRKAEPKLKPILFIFSSDSLFSKGSFIVTVGAASAAI